MDQTQRRSRAFPQLIFTAPKVPEGIHIKLENHFSPTGNSKKTYSQPNTFEKFFKKLGKKLKKPNLRLKLFILKNPTMPKTVKR